MPASRVTVVVAHAQADPVVRRALEDLERFAAAQLIRPLWVVDAGDDPTPALLCRRLGPEATPERAPLLDDLAEVPGIAVAHVVAVASSSLEPAEVLTLALASSHVRAQLERHRPPSAVVVEARVLAVDLIDTPTPLVDLFSPDAQANIVLVPEDRVSDDAFAVPISAVGEEVFAAHVAAGLATQAGLWRGMGEAPIEHGSAGVLGAGDAKVVVTRSFVRLAVGPPLPVDEALTTMRHLPIPSSCAPSHHPSKLVADWAGAMLGRAPELRFTAPPVPPDERERVGVVAAAGRLRREGARYLRGLPHQLRSGAAADLEQLAGESLNAAVGDDAVLTAVWAGMDRHGDQGNLVTAPTVEALEAAVAARRAQVDGSRVRRALWSELVDDALALADGGAAPGVEPPHDDGPRPVLTDPALFGPDPSGGAAAVREALTGGDVDGATLVGRLVGAVRAQSDTAERGLSSAMEEFRRARQLLDRRAGFILGALNWLMAALVCMVGVSLVLLTGRVESLGLLDWGAEQRAVAWLSLSTVALCAALACAVPVLRRAPVAGARPSSGGRAGLAVLFSFLVLVAVGTHDAVVRAPAPVGAVRIGEVLLTALFGAALVGLAYLCHQRGARRGATAAKALGAIALVHAWLSAVGGIVREGSWYAELPLSERRLQLGQWAAGLLLLVVATLAVIAWLRVKERLRLGAAAARLRWAEQATLTCADQAERLQVALGQLISTATALTRLAWLPFGRPVAVEDRRPAGLEDLASARSVRISRFELSEQGREALLTRIRREVAKPGWLQHEYAEVLHLFRPELAHQTGRDVASLAHLRPEQDAAIEAGGEATFGRPESDRWAFARMLDEGLFDRARRERVAGLASGQIFGLYFERDERQRGGGEAFETIEDLGGELVRGSAPHLPATFFRRMSLPVADDPRARFTPQVWWPTSVVPPPESLLDVAVHESEPVDAASAGLVLAFVRSDWTSPFAVSSLPLSEAAAPIVSNGHAPFEEHLM